MNDIDQIIPEETEHKREGPEAEFVQEGLRRYLVLTGDYSDYFYELEYSTVRRNNIPVLLPIQIREKDNHRQVCYDVTGKRSLESCAGEEHFSFIQCRRIIEEVVSMLRSLEDHLLEPEFICYAPSCIYRKGDRLFWVYGIKPGPGQSLQDNLEGFLSFLLAKLDYDDSAAVHFVYQAFWTVRKQGFSREVLEELLTEDPDALESHNKEINMDGHKAGEVLPRDSSQLLSQGEEEAVRAAPVYDDSAYTEKSRPYVKPLLFRMITLFLIIVSAGSLAGAGLLSYYAYKVGLTESGALMLTVCLAASVFSGIFCFRRARKPVTLHPDPIENPEEKTSNQRRDSDDLRFGPVTSRESGFFPLETGLAKSSEMDMDLPWVGQKGSLYPDKADYKGKKDESTIILSKSRRSCPVLKSMEDGSLTMIRELPFYIGSDPVLNQMVLIDKTISRQHAVILQGKKNSYRIKDLGSTNGTWMRGHPVNSAQPDELEEGCIVCFAQKKYRFIIHRDEL